MATANKMNIIAGEPVPPGFEDEVNRVPEIQQAVDQYKGNALLGLEYTLELHEDDRHEPSYYCVLCDKRGDPRTIMQHWTSFNHRLKYIEKHYPSAAREFNPVKYTPNSHSILIGIVQSLAEAIEDHYGRLTLGVCNGDEFRRLKSKIINEVNAKYHYDERSGPNFLHVIDRTLWENKTPASKLEQTLQITIKAPKRINEELGAQSSRDGLDEISSDSDGQGTSKKVKKKREQSPAFRILPRVRRSPPFEEERGSKENEQNEKKLPTPKELSLQASHIAQEKYKWEKYRCMLEIQLKQMGKIQQDYEKNPEKHPLYPEEWKKFWNRRYKELQAEKQTDPNKYDYKPEWIVFWTKRMKDLFNVEMDKKKKELKLKLGLPQDAEEKIEQLKEKYKVQVSRSATGLGGKTAANVRAKDPPSKANSGREREKNTTDVIDISDDESPARRRSRSRSQSRSHSHSHSRSRRSQSATRNAKRSRGRSESLSDSPLSDEYEPRPIHHQHHSHHHHRLHAAPPVRGYPPIEPDYYAALAYSRTRYSGAPPGHYGAPAPHYRVLEPHQYPKYERSPSPNSRSASVKEDPEPENDGPLTVVAVLRLLTALEEHLGSLGPKVVDLLGKALALEKVKAYSADDLLLNDDHCVFFETIKEKLKGLLIADMLDDQQKVRAVKRAIKNIAAVVHQVTTKGSKDDKKGDEAAGSKDENPVKKPGTVACIKDLPFDRQVVATKLAAALVMQGREDVSTEDMDKLIFMFILMVKLSKAKSEIDGKPVLTKNILPELGIPVPKSTMAALAALPALVDELFENDVSTMVHEAVEEVSNSNDTAERDSKNDPNSSMLESLTDSDLQTLLQNFKHLSTEEQHHLIAHLKKLETADPSRVEKLRKFVNIGDLAEVASTSASASAANSNRKEAQRSNKYDDLPPPGTNKERSKYSEDEGNDRRRGVNVTNPNKFSLDDEDEDDDYNVEDVFKAAINNVGDSARQSKSDSTKSTDTRGKSSQKASNIEPIVPVLSSPNALTFNPAGLNISLSDTQTLIANLMGSLQQSNANQKASGSKAAQSNAPQSASAVQTISTTTQQRQQQQQQQQMQQQSALQTSAPYYQQGQHQGYGNGYNQMAGVGDQTQAYYNTMGGYNNGAAGYPGYQQWGGSGAQNMQQYGMQNFMTPQQQQQQQQPMGYNMYGHGPN